MAFFFFIPPADLNSNEDPTRVSAAEWHGSQESRTLTQTVKETSMRSWLSCNVSGIVSCGSSVSFVFAQHLDYQENGLMDGIMVHV